MARKMKNVKTGRVVNVLEHIITKNFWEYYVLEDENNTEDIKFCYVMGFENEAGDVSISEISAYIVSRTKNFDELMPAAGFTWVEGE